MGASLNFNATSTQVDCGSASGIDDMFNGGGTMVAWINPNTVGEGSFGRVYDKGDSSNGTYCYLLNASGSYRVYFRAGHSTAEGAWYTSTTYSLNAWRSVWITYDDDSTANNPSIWVDGTSSSITEFQAPSGTYGSDAAINLIIGNESAGTRTFDGEICHMQFWTRILSTDEMFEATYKPGTVTSGLAAYWPLIGSTTSARDLSGNGNTGTITDGTESLDGPPIRSAS